uniref:Fe2OG dioxygenase domain-containing protein n=1 Tax=Ananas comosus var. bracteatus TaxID=296719 RepID=A0A6V7PDA3_ANACO|nr:unnamed protein product [Ananas comosus var. bracteatus]
MASASPTPRTRPSSAGPITTTSRLRRRHREAQQRPTSPASSSRCWTSKTWARPSSRAPAPSGASSAPPTTASLPRSPPSSAAPPRRSSPSPSRPRTPPPRTFGAPRGPIRVKNLNWVEGFHVSLGRCADVAIGGGEFALFRDLVNQYCKHMARIARTIFDAMAIDLKLTGDQSSSYLSEHDGTFRVYRYPRRPENCDNLGMEAHTDSSVLSILNEDDVGGLQILHRGEWLDVKPIADTLIVNLGDMMQGISSDRYKSVEHRVVASPFTERKSLCYFAFPVEDSVIISSTYKPFTYREFKAQVEEDIKATGAKVGLSRFRLSASN